MLEILKIVETHTLKTFPSVYKFRDIKEAHLTYAYHCCAFTYSETNSAEKLATQASSCSDKRSKPEISVHAQSKHSSLLHSIFKLPFGNFFKSNSLTNEANFNRKQKRFAENFSEEGYASYDVYGDSDRNIDNDTFGHIVYTATSNTLTNNTWNEFAKFLEKSKNIDDVNGEFGPLKPEETTKEVKDPNPIFKIAIPVDPTPSVDVICGTIVQKNYREVKCYPIPDAFNPCEDVMGNIWLRIAVWFVVIAAVLGNAAVMVVLMSGRFAMSVSKFLMCNLAFADFCMGIYLLIIAVIDVHTIGVYFNYAIDWQHGFGCKVAGFITVFASELSIFTLTVITLERWYAITYAIHLNRRLKLDLAVKIMIAGWVYASAMASLPLFGVSSYTKTSICLPMENKNAADVAYLVILLSINALAFILISACYGKMYVSIVGQQTRASISDMAVAKRMALLVFTDFACWAPIAFFGLTAVSGYPLINVTNSKILLVFFYPLNSCANPFLYAILTKQYRRDFFILLSRYGFCTKRAMKYKGTSSNHHNHRILSIKGRMAAPGAMLSQASFDGRVKGFYRCRRKAFRNCYSDSGEENGGRSVVYSTVDLYPESSISGDSSNEIVRIGFVARDEHLTTKRKKKGRKRASASNSDEDSPIQRGSHTRLHRLPSAEREEVLRRMAAEHNKHGSTGVWTTSTSLNSIHKSHKNCNFWIQRDSSSGEKSTTGDAELLHYTKGSNSRYNAIENASFVTSSQSNSAENTEI
ncbi:lutropin-choriogonadotropic hormone receptor-like protein [Leptotrombidium deliense]|uniref:Lutropin-choriogonadotropic hormone receptor-like protein n=1 Tax=Leptotrombidium deliense TaxID=299467 RepID=A0A443S5L7_9ACAR|nr:lutropin-choriogonadotropic hormone receptor-like protein [Leptotrombidium deliense]